MTKYQIGSIIKYYDETRKGILHYGEVVEIRLRSDGARYVTQDGKIVAESNVKSEFFELGKIKPEAKDGVSI
jgi:hypothetical protein